MKRLIALWFILFGLPASAQDIAWQLDRINPGFAVQLEYNPGGVYTHRLRGKEGDLFVIDSYFADQQNAAFTVWVTPRGNYVRLSASGIERTYVPHDCKRTIGSCTYTEIEGTSQKTFTRITTPDAAAGGYNYVQLDGNGAQMLSGFIALDDYGTAGDGFAIDADGAKTTYRLMGVVYP